MSTSTLHALCVTSALSAALALPAHAGAPERWRRALDAFVRRIPSPLDYLVSEEPPDPRTSASPSLQAAAQRGGEAPISYAEMIARILLDAQPPPADAGGALAPVSASPPRARLTATPCAADQPFAADAARRVAPAERDRCRASATAIAREIDGLLAAPRYLTRRELRVRGIELPDEALAQTRAAALAARERWRDIVVRLLLDPALESALLEQMGERRFLIARSALEERIAALGADAPPER
jgi:hypothetical protein